MEIYKEQLTSGLSFLIFPFSDTITNRIIKKLVRYQTLPQLSRFSRHSRRFRDDQDFQDF